MKKLFALLAISLASLLFAQADELSEVRVDDGIAKKWELKFDVAGVIGGHKADETGDPHGKTQYAESIDPVIGVGYNFNSNIFFGLNTGYWHKFNGAANNFVPVLADLVYRWNLGGNGKWSIFAEGRGGALFSTKGETKLSNGKDFEYSNNYYVDIQPGVYYRVLPNIDLRFSMGYGYTFSPDEVPDIERNENTFNVKFGMNFRRAPKAEVRVTPIEEPVTAPEPVVVPDPEPVKVVETTTEQQKQLGEREVVIFYVIRKHNILPEKDALLEELAEFTKTHKTSKVIVKSYADKGTGNYKLNQMYSRNRMNEVVKHLVEKYGISRDQIEASYYGDTIQPYEENDLNRCSIIVVKEIE